MLNQVSLENSILFSSVFSSDCMCARTRRLRHGSCTELACVNLPSIHVDLSIPELVLLLFDLGIQNVLAW